MDIVIARRARVNKSVAADDVFLGDTDGTRLKGLRSLEGGIKGTDMGRSWFAAEAERGTLNGRHSGIKKESLTLCVYVRGLVLLS